MGTAADYELMLRYLLGHRVVPVYIPKLLVLMRAGGLSNASVSSRLKAHMMDWKAWRINGFTPMPWTLPLKPIRKLSQWFTVNQRWDIRA
jgi:glycosyltransferase